MKAIKSFSVFVLLAAFIIALTWWFHERPQDARALTVFLYLVLLGGLVAFSIIATIKVITRRRE